MKTLRFIGMAFIAVVLSMSLYSCSDDDDDDDDNVEEPLINSISGSINGHDYVDLGLSVKWATCNVGASSPSDYGDYFAWGEIEPKSEYTEENSKTDGKKNMGSIAGDPEYDAARANWGGTWRLPTLEEIVELVSKCEHKWTTQEGLYGQIVTGPNGNSIFLPATGWHYKTYHNNAGQEGSYWSATPYEDNTGRAYRLDFTPGYFNRGWYYRYYGLAVRPVSE